MFNWASAVALSLVLLATLDTVAASTLPQGVESIGRLASDAEIAAWDIDVRPDFLGLPEGSGDVWQGEEIWLAQCASCHGDFGDANHIFAPIVLGNITEEDIAQGRVAALQNPAITRTTLMKVPTLSTLWDYIYRAMPWNAPKSLTPDEVYAVLAYILNLGYVVEDD
ncbi:MAG: cytochrome c, partial [Halieaceae bacterium]|nr:cytochrome c [Halieaceae bacterium]